MYYAYDMTNQKEIVRTRSASITEVEHLARIMSRSTENDSAITIVVLDEGLVRHTFFHDGNKFSPDYGED